MKHIALIVTAGDASGVQFSAPFFLDAIAHAASTCCGEVRVIPHHELHESLRSQKENTALLLLSASMPLLSQEDMKELVKAAQEEQCVAAAKGAIDGFPRCIVSEGRNVEIPLDPASLHVVRDPEDAAFAYKALYQRKNNMLMRQGVWLLDPGHTYIDMGVRIEKGTVIHPGCTITGKTTIGSDCLLLPNNRIHASEIGNGVTLESSVVLESLVGNETTIGPFAYIRPHTVIGDGCRIGDFVELKNSTIGNSTKVSHLTYVGDSDVGESVNLGCGVVFVNYDGKKKHRSKVEDHAFIGCNVNLVSPVHIGKDAYIAAGSTVTEDVPGEALAIARARQSTKEGWVTNRKQEGKL